MADLSHINGGRLPTNRIAANSYNPTAAGTTDFPVSYPIGTPVVVPHQGPHVPLASVIPGRADLITTADVIGLCAGAAVVGDPAIVQTSGPISLTTAQWDAVVVNQTGGLSQGSTYFLSATNAGMLSITPPAAQSGDFIKKVGIALSPTDFLIDASPLPVLA